MRRRLVAGRTGRPRRPVRIAATVALVCMVAGAGVALAYWAFTDASNTNFAAAAAETLPQGSTPAAAVSGPTVTITFATVSTTSAHQITTYSAARYSGSSSTAVPISGACGVAGSTVTCSDAPGDGQWRYTDTPTIASWVGTESAKSGPVTVDTTAPAVTVNPVATPTNNAAPAFSGAYGFASGDTAAVTVTVYAGTGTGGAVKATPTATLDTASHTWSTAALSPALTPDGTYTVAARQTDAAGNTRVATFPFVVDTTGPATPAPAATAAFTSGSDPMYVNGGAVTFTDAATDAGSGVASVSYYYCPTSVTTCTAGNGTLIGNSTSSSSGFAVTSGAPFAAEGAYKVVAVATDKVGNTATSSSPLLVTVDITPPTVSRPTVNGNA